MLASITDIYLSLGFNEFTGTYLAPPLKEFDGEVNTWYVDTMGVITYPCPDPS